MQVHWNAYVIEYTPARQCVTIMVENSFGSKKKNVNLHTNRSSKKEKTNQDYGTHVNYRCNEKPYLHAMNFKNPT